MTRTRTYAAGTAFVVVVVLLAGWFLLVAPKRAEAAELRAATVAQDETNDQLRGRLEELKAKSADLPALEARLAAVRKRLPQASELPTLLRQLSTQAKAAGVDLTSLSPSQPELVSEPAPAPVATAESTEGGDDAAAPAPAPAGPSEQLYAIAVNLEVTGRFANVTTFINGLEELPRSFLVTNFSLEPGEDEKVKNSLALSLTGKVFVLSTKTPEVAPFESGLVDPDTAATLAPSAPAGTGTPTTTAVTPAPAASGTT